MGNQIRDVDILGDKVIENMLESNKMVKKTVGTFSVTCMMIIKLSY